MMTAVGNDVGFGHIFVRQIIAQGAARRWPDRHLDQRQFGKSREGVSQGEGDRAEDHWSCRARPAEKWRAAGLDHCLIVETDSIHRVQECHVAIYHILWDLVHTLLADERGNLRFAQPSS